MPLFINTYSKSRPVFRKAEYDAFTELHHCASRQKRPKALELIAENEHDDYNEDKNTLYNYPESRSRRKVFSTRKTKPFMRKASEWKATPLRVDGKCVGAMKYSPMVTSTKSEEIDESILFMSDSSDESSTLSDADPTPTTTGVHNDSYNQYSDIEMPRDLPVEKRKARSTSSRILKLSQVSNIPTSSKLKSRNGGNAEKPTHSTLLEGKFLVMNIDPYEISDISGNGAECSISDSSLEVALQKDLSCPENSTRKGSASSKLVPVKRQTRHKLHTESHEAETRPTHSVYSLCISGSDSSLQCTPSKSPEPEPTLKILGKKVPRTTKNAKKTSLAEQSCSSDQNSKKQVSFLLGTKPDVFNPLDPTTNKPSHIYLPYMSPSNSILKKKVVPDKMLSHDVKASRATSTPQKSTRLSRSRGCHIMDLSFDISAVSLPTDNDLIVPPSTKNKDKFQDGEAPADEGVTIVGEKLLDFEPMCAEASTNMGTLVERTPKKQHGREQTRDEMTPSAQLKRSSPDAETPLKHLAKKSRIVKQNRCAGPHNKKRLDYQPIPPINPIPDCVITTLPFAGYRQNQQANIQALAPEATPLVDADCLTGYPQDVLETIPDAVFMSQKSTIDCPS